MNGNKAAGKWVMQCVEGCCHFCILFAGVRFLGLPVRSLDFKLILMLAKEFM